MGRAINNVDDGGSFEKLMEEVKKEAQDESKVMELLQLKILTAFVNKIRQEAVNDRNNNYDYNHVGDHTFVPRKKRSLPHSHGNTASSSQQLEDDHQKIRKSVSRKRYFDSDSSEEEEEEEEEEEIKKVKMIKKRKKVVERVKLENLGLGPPKVPDEWMTRITQTGGRDIKLVIMKQVFKTDLSRHHDRLSIPFKQIVDNSFLDDNEKLNLKHNTLTVRLMEPCNYFVSEMVLRRWDLHNSSNYALTTSWNSVLDRNSPHELKLNDIIQLWSFRVNKKLWFALIKVLDAPSDHNHTAVGSSGRGSDSDGSSGSGSSSGNGDGSSTSHSSTVVDQEPEY